MEYEKFLLIYCHVSVKNLYFYHSSLSLNFDKDGSFLCWYAIYYGLSYSAYYLSGLKCVICLLV